MLPNLAGTAIRKLRFSSALTIMTIHLKARACCAWKTNLRQTKRKGHTLSRNQISIVGEAEYIISRAQKRNARVVRLGSILFFSTETGDAWMIDNGDNLALCLARDGTKQDYMILETEDSFQIGWKAQYEIQDNIFIIALADWFWLGS